MDKIRKMQTKKLTIDEDLDGLDDSFSVNSLDIYDESTVKIKQDPSLIPRVIIGNEPKAFP